MKVIALDQSSTATGVAVFVDKKLKNHILIKPKVSKKVTQTVIEREPRLTSIKMTEADYGTTLLRITAIVDEVETILKKEKPDVVYFEEIFVKSGTLPNIRGFRSLARLQGFICHLCHKLGIRYVIVEESVWIKTFGTFGKDVKRDERKKIIMKKINDLYGLDIKVDDVSDAISIGTYAIEKENCL